jgi:HEAT repeat protein
LLHDKFAQIRILALETLYAFQREGAIDTLEKSLFDRNQSVRSLSRYLLSKHKKYDFAAIYRGAIQKSEQLYSSICGLGETGNTNDSKIISTFMSNDTIKIVKASINALARLNFQEYEEELIFIINDERVGISNAARRVLYKRIDGSDADTIYGIFKQALYDHVRINTCILLCSLSKWDAIRYIIEFCADKNDSISALGQNAIENWKVKYNFSFTTPTKKQIEEIKKSIMDYGKSIKGSDRNFIEFCIRDFCK